MRNVENEETLYNRSPQTNEKGSREIITENNTEESKIYKKALVITEKSDVKMAD